MSRRGEPAITAIAAFLQVKTVHEKLKIFQCTLCPTSFPYRDGLTRHVQMVHDQVRKFLCEYCPLKFKMKAHLNKHLLSMHRQEYQELPS